MEITMENQDKFNEIAYKKAQKRVKDIRTYYYMVLGYLAVGYFIVSRNYDGEFFFWVTEFIYSRLISEIGKKEKPKN